MSSRFRSYASEVEKAELTLESTRRNLESALQEVRMRDRELERAQEKYDTVCTDLEASTNKVKDLESKIEDLKIQVRHELMKNENIERGLETIPRLKEDISERNQKISRLEKSLEERSVLLSASRKAARDYKERLRDLERREEESYCLKEELELAKSEVDTLKMLMSGKDSIVMHRCQQLDLAKQTVDSLRVHARSEDEKVRLRKIQHALDVLKQLHSQAASEEGREGLKERPVPHNRFVQSRPRSAATDSHQPGIDVNVPPYVIDSKGNNEHYAQHERQNGPKTASQEGGKSPSNYIFLEQFLEETERITPKPSPHQQQKSARGKTGHHGARGANSGGLVQRSASFHHLGPSNPTTTTAFSHTVGLRQGRKAVSSHNVQGGRGGRPHTSPRAKASSGEPSRSTLYYHGKQGSSGNLYKSETGARMDSKYQPSLEYCLGVSTDDDLTTDCLSARDNHNEGGPPPTRPKSAFTIAKRGHSNTGSDTESGSLDNSTLADIVGGPLTNQQLQQLGSLTGAQKDNILNEVIQIGDRVSITVAQKPPRYGRKKPKPIVYTGIVKYKGTLDSDHFDARLFAGIRLDAPLGDSDGTHKGKRYMFTPPEHAKFFKIRDLDSVLDIQTSLYIPTTKLILFHYENSPHLYSNHQSPHPGTTANNNNNNSSQGALPNGDVPVNNGYHGRLLSTS